MLIAGGTIDKIHDPYLEQIVFGPESNMPELLSESRAKNVQVRDVFMKDSLDMNDDDRQLLADAVNKAGGYKSIVITHGTSTMVETAQYLKEHRGLKDQTIVLTGSFRPFSFPRGDAKFNVGSALSAARILKPGIYIAMHGLVFEPHEVEKQPELLQFAGLSERKE